MGLYREGGLSLLSEEPPKTGRPKKLKVETVAKIQPELSAREGFSSYREIQLWVLAGLNLQISYSTIHTIVSYELIAEQIKSAASHT